MTKWTCITLVGLLTTVSSGVVYAEKPKSFSPFSISASKISTGEADVGSGEQTLQRDSWMVDANVKLPINREWSVGLSLSYADLDYDWQGIEQPIFDGSVNTWSDLKRYSAGVSVMYRPNKNWMFMMAPKLQYAYADVDEVSSSNAVSYGVVATGMYRFDDGNMLGFGVAYLNDISEVRTVPYIAVRWQLSDNLVLGNPFSAGFSGPAGLELTYQLNPAFDFGVGTSKRTQRFLIQDEDTTVEVDEWVSFLRAGWSVSSAFSLNAYAGYYFNGEMELSEPEVVESIDNQVAFALAAEYKF